MEEEEEEFLEGGKTTLPGRRGGGQRGKRGGLNSESREFRRSRHRWVEPRRPSRRRASLEWGASAGGFVIRLAEGGGMLGWRAKQCAERGEE